MIHESIFTEVTVTGITVYGIALLFIKALLILLLAQVLSDSFEFSPASIRHTVWLIAMATLAALPVLTILLPAWRFLSIDLGAQSIDLGANVIQESTTVTVVPPALSIVDWLAIAYVVVAVCRLAYLTFEVVKVAWITTKSRRANSEWYRQARQFFNGRLRIKVSADLEGPVTWGSLYPVILLPQGCDSWSRLEKEIVLRHELGHIQRTDWLAQLLGQLIVVLYWPVPGISRAFRSLSLEAERACDDLVLTDGVTPADYAALLLRQARVNKLQATVALGKPSELAQRIRHIVNSYVDRAGERKARLWLAGSAMIFVLPFAAVQATGKSSQEGLFADMVLVSIVTSPEKKISALDIGKPVRPAPAKTPPHGPLIDQGIDMNSKSESISVPQIASSPAGDLRLPDLSHSAVLVRIKQQPEYPPAALRRGIEGRVVVEFDIDENGSVTNPRIMTSGSPKVFHRSVLKAIGGYQYEPFPLDGEAIVVQGMREEFHFKLVKEKPFNRTSTGDLRAGQEPPINSS